MPFITIQINPGEPKRRRPKRTTGRPGAPNPTETPEDLDATDAATSGTGPEPDGAQDREAGEVVRDEDDAEAGEAGARVRRVRRMPVVLGVLTVLLGGGAVWSGEEANGIRNGPGTHNAALTDAARTSEVKGKVTDAVNTIFSYDYTDLAKTEQAAGTLLTGKAVQQYDTMLAQVHAQGPSQKLVLTTTVTDSSVERLEGDSARVLLFADQRNTRTSRKDTTYAAAMLAVDVVRRSGTWKIANIDTLNAPR